MAYDPAPQPQDFAQPYPSQPAGTEYDVTELVRFLLGQGMGGLAQLMPSLSGPNAALMGGFAPLAEDLGTTGATNAFQDQMTIQMDPAMGVFGGPGSYSPDAFNPVMSYETIATPWVSRLETYSQNPDSIEGMIAQHIMAGGTASSAYRLIKIKADRAQAAIEAGEEPEMGDARILELIPPSVPRYDELGGEVPGTGGPDYRWIMDTAQDMDSGYSEDLAKAGMSGTMYDDAGNMISSGGSREWVTDENGNRSLVEVTSTPSESAQYYLDRGLSLPTDEWNAATLLGPGWEQQQAETQQLMADYDAMMRQDRRMDDDISTAARQSEINEMPYTPPPLGTIQPTNTTTAGDVLWNNGNGGDPNGGFTEIPTTPGAVVTPEGSGVPSGWPNTVSEATGGGGGFQQITPEGYPVQSWPGGGGNLPDFGFVPTPGGMSADQRMMLASLVPQVQNSGTVGTYGGFEPIPQPPTPTQQWPNMEQAPTQQGTGAPNIGAFNDPQLAGLLGQLSTTNIPTWNNYLQSQQAPGFDPRAVGTQALQGSIAELLRGLPGQAVPTPAGAVPENPGTAQWIGDNPTTTPTSMLPTYSAVQSGGAPSGGTPPSSTNPATTMAMLQAMLPSWMTNSPMIPAVMAQAGNGGNVQPPPPTPGLPQIAEVPGAGAPGRPSVSSTHSPATQPASNGGFTPIGPALESGTPAQSFPSTPQGATAAPSTVGPTEGVVHQVGDIKMFNYMPYVFNGNAFVPQWEWDPGANYAAHGGTDVPKPDKPYDMEQLRALITPTDRRNYNEGVGDRAASARDARKREQEIFREREQPVRRQRLRAINDTYGYDYGKALAISYLLNRQGLSPTTLQMAQRGLPAAAAGIRRA